METPHPVQAREAVAFSLLENPFALLGATPRTPRDDLAGLAEDRGTDAARTALRTLSIPRTRLDAELAFLPGAADQAGPVLDALRQGVRPVLDKGGPGSDLPPAAVANVLAHLCAAGLSVPADWGRLVAVQPPPGDPALLAAVAADRTEAGFPPPQPGALPPVQDALAEQHAAALVAACRLGHTDADAAESLAALLRTAPDGPPVAFLRRAAASWARQTAATLAATEDGAGPALAAVQRTPSADTMAALLDVAGHWAALTAPQRLADARVGLDHDPTVRIVKPWRQAGIQVADDDHPELSLHLTTRLAALFGDMPGYGAQLREDVARCRNLAEEKALDGVLGPLRALVSQYGAEPGPLLAALGASGFGPGATGAAAALWAAFDTAATAAAPAEVPWALVRNLAVRLHNEHDQTDAAIALNPGLIARAEAAGLSDLADHLRADLRGLQRSVATQRYRALMDKKQGAKALAQSRILLPLLDDPTLRGQVLAEQRTLLRQRRGRWTALGVILAIVLLCCGAYKLDSDYAATAPYRTQPSRSLAQGASQGAVAAAPAAPSPGLPPAFVPPTSVGPPKLPVAPPVKLAFPTRGGATPEQQPATADAVHSLAEGRWCAFNEVRLDAATQQARPDQVAALDALSAQWGAVCTRYPIRRRDEDQLRGEVQRGRARLEAEGRAMLERPAP